MEVRSIVNYVSQITPVDKTRCVNQPASLTSTAPRIGSLCSGYGGLDMAVREVFGGSVAWHSEIDPAASAVLAHHWSNVVNLGDLAVVDFGQVEPVDVLASGFPCTDLSLAGRMAGIAPGTRSGLWLHVARAIDVLRPSLVVIENVPGLLSTQAHSDVVRCPWCVGDRGREPALRALGAVLAGLADIGYDATWACVRASEVGAPHIRRRVFVLAVPADASGAGLPRTRLLRWVAERRHGTVAADSRSRRFGAGTGLRAGGSGELGGRRLGDESRPAAADAEGERRGQGEPEAAVREWGAHVGEHGGADHAGAVEWGAFRPAIERWERLTRPAPRPTDDHGRLSPLFVEWLMGVELGHVTGVPGLSRSAQLRVLGNGVVPAQGVAALRLLLDRLDVVDLAA
ncbi:DNA cytosine methyltransferase [Streptomyces alboflavus]|uniref:DNA cytosine methyltransferase n=1 Tax=Streptomyces alboflavus TaxID=67267 RepID=UPI0036BDBE5A